MDRQTVMHAHVQVIPRWNRDVPDPRGGIRWVIVQGRILERKVTIPCVVAE
jgi:diadenosine tetraphosphate (Ap4A) HIT family hydrolase